MKRLIFPVLILAATVLPISYVSAVDFPNPLNVGSFEALLEAVMNFIFWVGITLAPLMLIVAGLMYVTSAGSPTGVTKAKNLMLWTLVGLAVLIAAKGLVSVIRSILGF
ncbi:MAG: hypothetical protein HYT21_01580 [Candidatus Nealsonbacteria bacterium]|nr:hypothetical protein [Candidatus Nealsonbacteria bacterium]